MFENYQERGKRFKAVVKGLKEKGDSLRQVENR